jgi:hypothetical protein
LSLGSWENSVFWLCPLETLSLLTSKTASTQFFDLPRMQTLSFSNWFQTKHSVYWLPKRVQFARSLVERSVFPLPHPRKTQFFDFPKLAALSFSTSPPARTQFFEFPKYKHSVF